MFAVVGGTMHRNCAVDKHAVPFRRLVKVGLQPVEVGVESPCQPSLYIWARVEREQHVLQQMPNFSVRATDATIGALVKMRTLEPEEPCEEQQSDVLPRMALAVVEALNGEIVLAAESNLRAQNYIAKFVHDAAARAWDELVPEPVHVGAILCTGKGTPPGGCVEGFIGRVPLSC
jgi:hypothetical protein